MQKNSKIIYLFLSSLFFIIFNFYISDFIVNNCVEDFVQNPIFQLTYIENIGAAFNIFEGYKIFLISFSALALYGIYFYTLKHIKKIPVIGLFFISLLVSGIFNNMLERVLYGYVRDFIKLNFIDFPVFNISDLLINISVIGIVYLILKNNYLKK